MSHSALVFETDEALRGLISVVLTRQGLRPALASDARHAVAQLSSNGGFDVIVLDLATPGGSGYEVIQHLTKSKPDALNRLVGLTVNTDVEIMQHVGGAAAFRMLRKPFEISELENAVRACLRGAPFPAFQVQCLSCEREESYPAPSDAVARQLARNRGWHVVTFVRYVAGLNHELFITFCPRCAKPEPPS